MKVWLVTAVGVYDQGVHFAAASEERAKAFADEHSPDSDGYHAWRIDELTIDAPRWPLLPKHPASLVDKQPQSPTR